MQPQPSLVRPDCGIELYTEAVVYLYLALVVHPGNAKQELSFRRYQSLQQCILTVLLLICLNHHAKGLQNFLHSLMELRLGRILGHYIIKDLIYI